MSIKAIRTKERNFDLPGQSLQFAERAAHTQNENIVKQKTGEKSGKRSTHTHTYIYIYIYEAWMANYGNSHASVKTKRRETRVNDGMNSSINSR